MEPGTQPSENQDDLPPSPAPGEEQPTPPTDQQNGGHTNNGNEDRRLSALENLLREQNRQIQEQNNELSRLRTARENPPPPPPNPEEERAAFYNNPKEETRKIVQDALRETIAPLTEFVSEFRSQSKVGKLVSNVKNDSRFSSVWDSDIEEYVEQALNAAAAQGVQLNDTIALQAAVNAVGMKQIGALGNGSTRRDNPPAPRNDGDNRSPNNQPNRSDRPMPPTPPHLRPTAPSGSRNDQGRNQQRPLTEAEKRLARENKMTDVEYLQWLEAPADQVAFTDIGKPKPQGGR